MQSTKKAQLAAALAATLGFGLHSTATAADPSGSGLQTPTSIASDNSTPSTKKDKTSKTAPAKGKASACKGKASACKGEPSSCKGKAGSCASTK